MAQLDPGEVGVPEEISERLRLAERKAPPFIQICCSQVERHGRVPDMAHELHLPGVIPDIGTAQLHACPGLSGLMNAWAAADGMCWSYDACRPASCIGDH